MGKVLIFPPCKTYLPSAGDIAVCLLQLFINVLPWLTNLNPIQEISVLDLLMNIQPNSRWVNPFLGFLKFQSAWTARMWGKTLVARLLCMWRKFSAVWSQVDTGCSWSASYSNIHSALHAYTSTSDLYDWESIGLFPHIYANILACVVMKFNRILYKLWDIMCHGFTLESVLSNFFFWDFNNSS